MPPELLPDAPGDYRNARFLATAASLAYLPAAEGKAAFRDQLGLDANLISVDNTQAYVATNDAHVVVAFRGSECPTTLDGFKDWLLTNANNYLILPEGQIGTDFAAAGVGTRFHKGFLEALAEIWDPLYAAVDAAVQQKERPVWVTGHSLGGGLALLAAWRFQRNFIPVHQVYTFGAPMVGNAAAAAAFVKEFPNKIFRFIDDRDFVPRLPTISLVANAYEHCQAEVALGAGAAAAAALKQMAGTAADGVLNLTLMDELWKQLQGNIDAHMMPNYLSLIGAKCGDKTA